MTSHNNSNNSSNRDSLLIRRIMDRLQLISPPYLYSNSFLSQPLDDSLLTDPNSSFNDRESEMTKLANEEAKVEREIIRRIVTGQTDSLLPNSGQAVTICNHQICIEYDEERGSNIRHWEWNGHVMMFDKDKGSWLDYIYGNYSEPVTATVSGSGAGLQGLICDGNSTNQRIRRRNRNVNLPR